LTPLVLKNNGSEKLLELSNKPFTFIEDKSHDHGSHHCCDHNHHDDANKYDYKVIA